MENIDNNTPKLEEEEVATKKPNTRAKRVSTRKPTTANKKSSKKPTIHNANIQNQSSTDDNRVCDAQQAESVSNEKSPKKEEGENNNTNMTNVMEVEPSISVTNINCHF